MQASNFVDSSPGPLTKSVAFWSPDTMPPTRRAKGLWRRSPFRRSRRSPWWSRAVCDRERSTSLAIGEVTRRCGRSCPISRRAGRSCCGADHPALWLAVVATKAPRVLGMLARRARRLAGDRDRGCRAGPHGARLRCRARSSTLPPREHARGLPGRGALLGRHQSACRGRGRRVLLRALRLGDRGRDAARLGSELLHGPPRRPGRRGDLGAVREASRLDDLYQRGERRRRRRARARRGRAGDHGAVRRLRRGAHGRLPTPRARSSASGRRGRTAALPRSTSTAR